MADWILTPSPKYTEKPVYNGHFNGRPPLYNSQVTESQKGL